MLFYLEYYIIIFCSGQTSSTNQTSRQMVFHLLLSKMFRSDWKRKSQFDSRMSGKDWQIKSGRHEFQFRSGLWPEVRRKCCSRRYFNCIIRLCLSNLWTQNDTSRSLKSGKWVRFLWCKNVYFKVGKHV